MSPPNSTGGIACNKARLPYKTPIPVGPNILCPLKERKSQALQILDIKDVGSAIQSNQLEELRWAVSLFFTVTNNPVIEIYVSLDEAFSNLLEKARTKPMEVDEAQEKVAYEGIAKAAENAFEMYNKLKIIREEFDKQFGEFDILDLVKQGEKSKPLEEKINFAERRAQRNAEKEGKSRKEMTEVVKNFKPDSSYISDLEKELKAELKAAA